MREGGDAGAGRSGRTRGSLLGAGARGRQTGVRRGRPPGAGRREARPARAPAALHRLPRPLRCHLTPPLSRGSAPASRPHTQPGEECFCSLWAVVSQEFDVIISQNGTAKLRVAFFSSLYCVKKKKKKMCASPSTEREWLSNKRANKVSWVEIELYKCFRTRKTIFTGVCTVCVVWQFFVLKRLGGKSEQKNLITEFTFLGYEEGMVSRKFQ